MKFSLLYGGLNDFICKALRNHEKKQSALAKRLGKTASAVSQILCGKTTITYEMLMDIIDFLDLEERELQEIYQVTSALRALALEEGELLPEDDFAPVRHQHFFEEVDSESSEEEDVDQVDDIDSDIDSDVVSDIDSDVGPDIDSDVDLDIDLTNPDFVEKFARMVQEGGNLSKCVGFGDSGISYFPNRDLANIVSLPYGALAECSTTGEISKVMTKNWQMSEVRVDYLDLFPFLVQGLGVDFGLDTTDEVTVITLMKKSNIVPDSWLCRTKDGRLVIQQNDKSAATLDKNKYSWRLAIAERR
jgi:transcriptional regulator with XRE-family HTH domain